MFPDGSIARSKASSLAVPPRYVEKATTGSMTALVLRASRYSCSWRRRSICSCDGDVSALGPADWMALRVATVFY